MDFHDRQQLAARWSPAVAPEVPARSPSPAAAPEALTLKLSGSQALSELRHDASSSSNQLRSRLSNFSHSGSQFQTPRGTEISHLSAFSASRSLTSASRSLTRSLSRTPSGWLMSQPTVCENGGYSGLPRQFDRTASKDSTVSSRHGRHGRGHADVIWLQGAASPNNASSSSRGLATRNAATATGSGGGRHSRPTSSQSSKAAIFEEALEVQSLAASSCATSTLTGTSSSTFSNLSPSSLGGTAGTFQETAGPTSPTLSSARATMGGEDGPSQHVLGSTVDIPELRPRATDCKTPRIARHGRSSSSASKVGQEQDIMELLMDCNDKGEMCKARRRGGSVPTSARRRRRAEGSSLLSAEPTSGALWRGATSPVTTTASSGASGPFARESAASSSSASSVAIVGASMTSPTGGPTAQAPGLSEGVADSLDVEIMRSSRGISLERSRKGGLGASEGSGAAVATSGLPSRRSPTSKPASPAGSGIMDRKVGAGAPSASPATPRRQPRRRETFGSVTSRSSLLKAGRSICSSPVGDPP